MDNDLMAGSRSSHLLDDEMDAECLSLLSRYISPKAALIALNDESYLAVLLPVLYTDGTDDGAVTRLRAAFAPKVETKSARPAIRLSRDPLGS